MAAARNRGRRRTLVLASLPRLCVICGGSRWVHSVGYGPVPCPHCRESVPVLHLPIRTDYPSGDA